MNQALLTHEIIARKFAFGQVLDIEIQDSGGKRFQSRLLGLKPGRYLLAELPSHTKHGNLQEKLYDRQALVVRTICEHTTGECLGFQTLVSGKVVIPDRLLFLDFPHSVKVHELRSEQRVLVSQPARLHCDTLESELKGFLTDLSGGGCRFEFSGLEVPELVKDKEVQIDFQHPTSGEDQEYNCRICSVRKSQKSTVLGLAFVRQ